jgi:hypothetical protein
VLEVLVRVWGSKVATDVEREQTPRRPSRSLGLALALVVMRLRRPSSFVGTMVLCVGSVETFNRLTCSNDPPIWSSGHIGGTTLEISTDALRSRGGTVSGTVPKIVRPKQRRYTYQSCEPSVPAVFLRHVAPLICALEEWSSRVYSEASSPARTISTKSIRLQYQVIGCFNFFR